MELTNAKCPNCGAALIVDTIGEKATCQYCGSQMIIKQAVERIRIDGISDFDSMLVAAQNEIDFAEDFDSARNYYRKALDLRPNDYRALWGVFLCEMNSIIYHHNRKGFVKVPGDTMDCVRDNINRYGARAYRFAPEDVKEYYNDVFEYYLQ